MTGEQVFAKSDMFEQTCSYKVRPGVPLVRDVYGMPKAQYVKFIHTPQFLPEPARFFEADWMEFFSRTPWYAVPIFWAPIIIAIVAYAISEGASLTRLPIHFAIGVSTWSIIEYTLHRWVFHLDDYVPDHPLAIGAHFLLHGVHHLLPQDAMRLVFPPALAVPLAVIFYPIIRTFYTPLHLSIQDHNVLFAGALAGYVMYDMFHYYTHHGSPDGKSLWGQYVAAMKTYHMKHHYVNYHLGYGITSKVWDYVLGTVLLWKVQRGEKAAEPAAEATSETASAARATS